MSTTLLDRPLTPTSDATRREFIVGGLAAGFILAACGNDGADDQAAPTTTTTGPGTIIVENRFGTFEVPADPQRVVGLEGRRDFETAIALDLGIVGVGNNALDEDTAQTAPFIDFDISAVEVVVQVEPNLELIASLRPDLILTRDSNIEELQAELIALAPVIPVGSSDATDPWRADLERVAVALGREEQAAEVLGAFDDEVAAVRDRHGERIDTAVVAIVQAGDGEFSSSSTDGFYLQAHTLADLGGTLLPFLVDLPANEFGSASFSIEQTGELAPADAILLIVNTAEQRAEVETSPLWQSLPAVQAGRVVVTDFRTNYGSVYAAGAALALLDDLYATLA